MKKLSFLFLVVALFSFIALSSCKSSTKPAAESEEVEEVMEEPTEEATDEAMEADTTMAEEAQAEAEEGME